MEVHFLSILNSSHDEQTHLKKKKKALGYKSKLITLHIIVDIKICLILQYNVVKDQDWLCRQF